MLINNCLLPEEIMSFPFSIKRINDPQFTIREFGEASNEFCLYGPEMAQSETEALVRDYEVQILGLDHPGFEFLKNEPSWFEREIVVGKRDILDGRKAIIIGDLGNDAPFCLDFETNPIDPPILYFTGVSAWKKVFDSYEEFYRKIKHFLV